MIDVCFKSSHLNHYITVVVSLCLSFSHPITCLKLRNNNDLLLQQFCSIAYKRSIASIQAHTIKKILAADISAIDSALIQTRRNASYAYAYNAFSDMHLTSNAYTISDYHDAVSAHLQASREYDQQLQKIKNDPALRKKLDSIRHGAQKALFKGFIAAIDQLSQTIQNSLEKLNEFSLCHSCLTAWNRMLIQFTQGEGYRLYQALLENDTISSPKSLLGFLYQMYGDARARKTFYLFDAAYIHMYQQGNTNMYLLADAIDALWITIEEHRAAWYAQQYNQSYTFEVSAHVC